MTNSFAVEYLNQDIYKNVKKDADDKFGNKNSYVKNLWILKTYKKRGGKVKYDNNDKKPSNEKIKKSVSASFVYQPDLSCEIKNFLWQSEINNNHNNASKIISDIEDYYFEIDAILDSNGSELQDIIESPEESLAADNRNQDKINEIYKKFHSLVNMSASSLESWAENPCSKLASLSRAPINRVLRLLRKDKADWTLGDAKQANRVISFISRMKGAEQGEKTKTRDGKTCPSKRDISLKNWGYSP